MCALTFIILLYTIDFQCFTKKLQKHFFILTNDLNINPNNIENNHEYTIPKYRAIYLDSLKYNMVKTNNLFDEFINKFKKYKNISLDINDDILREYQVVGVKWLYNIYKCGFGAILADEMGLGKSIQIIYFIKQLIKENSEYKFLIVAPTSLIYNLKYSSSAYALGGI